ncbi:hypothetical protein A2154_00105 [Candidatus Gottesmanbacteria bacterium RBG_16_43_7]|uniref:Glycosyltransferase RgtA/B/C/D-like domain-containing protein n=1 Tax=Candidatus Gottesmanbacteria bacterium RBG_16_43_7 TaxID=1798373 RepID=A0A1F5Z9U5_9BACT|nr:MAG: hypothetical protein A2154_00105 [Candidatus Gottesmanbacteria bacterium RBG_16_43_7]
MRNKYSKWILVCSILFIGVLFRLWFIRLVPQPFLYDQDEYKIYALKMMQSPFYLASHSYRTYPYPLLMAAVYTIFGYPNHQALFVVQAVIDVISGLLVYLSLSVALGIPLVSWIGFLLYIINPFTSGYVGVGLSEVLGTFFVTATLFTGVLFVRNPSVIGGLMLGLAAGMAAETRNAAFIWALVPIVLAGWWVKVWKHKLKYTAVISGLILTMVYPLIVNWRDYREINVSNVDSFYAREFFNGAILRILPPFTYDYPREVKTMYWEYYSEFYPGRTREERRAMAAKYLRKGLEIVRSDPWDYIRWRFFKMWYVWQKENVFFYREPGFESHKMITYIGNYLLLCLAGAGMMFGWVVSKKRLWRYLLLTMIGSVGYATLAFSISHAEYRLTIPYYPMLFMAASVCVYTGLLLYKKFRK